MSNRQRRATFTAVIATVLLAFSAWFLLARDTTFASHGVGAEISPASVTVAPGGSVTVALTATTTAPAGLGAWIVKVGYDAAVVSVTGCTGSSGSLCSANLATNPLQVNGDAFPGLTGTVTLANITYTAIGASGTSTPLTVTITEFRDGDTNVIAGPTAANGLINVVGNKLAFTTQPGGGTAAQAWAVQPVVEIRDPNNVKIATATDMVTLHIATGTAGATLTCTQANNQVAAVAGVATFTGCKIDKTGAYTLMAMGTGLASATSSSFNITAGTAAKLGFTTQPGGGTGGLAWSQQPVVAVQDAGGNTVPTATSSITLSITAGTGTAGASLTCANSTVTAVDGVATFAGCKIDKAGTGYTLTATATGLTDGASASFDITVGTAAKLGFTTQPGGGAAGQAWAAQPVVAVQDAGGNTVTSATNAVTLAIATGPTGATLTCTSTTVNASTGVATFAGCKIEKAGSYTLDATATGLTSATSASFNITAGTATKLVFITQLANGIGTAPLDPQPVVAVQDAFDNTVTTDSSTSVTIAITSGTGTVGATLSCTGGLSKTVTSGLATFAGCTIAKVGTGYNLTATATDLTSAVSASFNIGHGEKAQVAFIVQPGGAVAGQPLNPQPQVEVQDSAGNRATSDNTTLVELKSIDAAANINILVCTANPLTVTNGLAVFSGCNITKAGAFGLTAGAPGLSAATSNTFTITAGTAVKLGFFQQPGGATENVVWPQQPVVAVQDTFGNTVTTDNTTSVAITITSGSGAPGAVLTCTTGLTKTVAAGLASFEGCKIDKKGDGYTLTATATGLTSATSDPFNIVSIVLVFTPNKQPIRAAHTFAFGIQPEVEVQLEGVKQTTFTGSVTLRIKAGTGTPGATLSCAANPVPVVNGVAAFSGCKIDLKGADYVLEAVGSAVGTGTSQPFSVTWAGDANGDCKVDIVDFSVLVASFLKALTDPAFDTGADMNGDQAVDIQDFSILKTMFGTRCPTMARNPLSGPVGTQVTVSGSEYGANKVVTITFDDAAIVTTPAAVTADSSGNFSATITVPSGAAVGTHVIKASQRNGRVIAGKTFEVTSAGGGGGGGGGVALSIDPPTVLATVGQVFTLNIKVDAGSHQVDAIDAFLDFSPAVLKVVDVSGAEAAAIEPSPASPLSSTLANSVDNTAGRIDFSAGRQTGAPPATGTFNIATVRYKAVATAGAQITFSTALPRSTGVFSQGKTVTGPLVPASVQVSAAFTAGLQSRPMSGLTLWAFPAQAVYS